MTTHADVPQASASALALDRLVQVIVMAAGQKTGLSVLITPKAALALQAELATAILAVQKR